MIDQQLDLAPLERAVQRLKAGWVRYQQDIRDDQVRDGLIQRFEFTYEISHKMLRRYLVQVAPTPELYTEMVFADLIRSGSDQGLLLGDWSDWRLFREMRSRTSHTYDEAIALEVVARIPRFLEEAEYLLERLQARQARSGEGGVDAGG